MKEYSGNGYYFYTCCIHGLYTKKVPFEYVCEIKPDLIIVQIGVVDACRRTMSIYVSKILRHIPIVSSVIKFICQKKHFFITRFVNIHYSQKEDLFMLFDNILKELDSNICFIPIAPAGRIMKSKAYNFEEDVSQYNNVFIQLKHKYGKKVLLLDPYKGIDPNDLFLHDGHHLNLAGEELVFSAVKKIL